MPPCSTPITCRIFATRGWRSSTTTSSRWGRGTISACTIARRSRSLGRSRSTVTWRAWISSSTDREVSCRPGGTELCASTSPREKSCGDASRIRRETAIRSTSRRRRCSRAGPTTESPSSISRRARRGRGSVPLQLPLLPAVRDHRRPDRARFGHARPRCGCDGGSTAEAPAPTSSQRGGSSSTGPEQDGSLAVTRPVGGGRMQLWDLELDAPVGEESDRIVPLGSGIVARYDRYAESGEPRLEHAATGDGHPASISPDSRSTSSVLRARGQLPPSPGGPREPSLRSTRRRESRSDLPWRYRPTWSTYAAVSETPDSTRAVITWYGSAQAPTETARLRHRDRRAPGAGARRSRHESARSTTISLSGIAQDYARRYDIRTLEPISALAQSGRRRVLRLRQRLTVALSSPSARATRSRSTT